MEVFEEGIAILEKAGCGSGSNTVEGEAKDVH